MIHQTPETEPMGSRGAKRPEIFEFSRIGAYLAAYVNWKKATTRQFSFQALARGMEGVSVSLLHMVARGERAPTQVLVHRLAKTLKLSQRELEFALALAAHERASTPSEQLYFGARLLSLKPRNIHLLDLLIHAEVIGKWHNLAILEMAELSTFRDDPVWIAKRLDGAITPVEAKESLSLLLSTGHLRRREDGNLERAADGFRTAPSISPTFSRNCHRQMMERASASLDTQSPSERYFIGTSLAIDASQSARAGELIEEMRERLISELGNAPVRDEVYHLGIQWFRVTCGNGAVRNLDASPTPKTAHRPQ